MFDKSTKNGATEVEEQVEQRMVEALGKTGSDQVIKIRHFCEPVEVTIAGEQFLLRPPSFWLSNVIKRFRIDMLKKSRERIVELKEALAGIDKTVAEKVKNLKSDSQSAPAKPRRKNAAEKTDESVNEIADKTPYLTTMLDANIEYSELMLEMSGEKDAEMLRYVQLILLDAKNPEWKKSAPGFPKQEILDQGLPLEMIERYATLDEINVVLDVYDQMNKPELPRKNFERTGGALL